MKFDCGVSSVSVDSLLLYVHFVNERTDIMHGISSVQFIVCVLRAVPCVYQGQHVFLRIFEVDGGHVCLHFVHYLERGIEGVLAVPSVTITRSNGRAVRHETSDIIE